MSIRFYVFVGSREETVFEMHGSRSLTGILWLEHERKLIYIFPNEIAILQILLTLPFVGYGAVKQVF